MGDTYGPKGKEEVNCTWQQISSILHRNLDANSANEIKRLIQEKKEKLQILRDESWAKGLEESQKYLDESPELKQMIEDNADSLKKGNFGELWSLNREGVSSGKSEEVEKYVKIKVHQAKSTEVPGWNKWMFGIPSGSKVIPQLQSLRTIAQKKGSKTEIMQKDKTV